MTTYFVAPQYGQDSIMAINERFVPLEDTRTRDNIDSKLESTIQTGREKSYSNITIYMGDTRFAIYINSRDPVYIVSDIPDGMDSIWVTHLFKNIVSFISAARLNTHINFDDIYFLFIGQRYRSGAYSRTAGA